MKNIVLLFCLMMIAGMAMGQLQVVSTGDTKIKRTLTVGENIGAGEASVNVGGDRAVTGGAAFNFYTAANPGSGDYQFRLASSAGGTSAFTHFGTKALRIQTDAAEDILFRTNGSTQMTVKSNGTDAVVIEGVANVSGGVTTFSDRQLKSNVKSLNRGLETLMQINPVSYKYNGKANTPTHRAFVGVVAQELQKVAPEFVSELEYENTDEEGNVIESGTYLRVHDTELKFLMIKAIQEQQEMIETLQAQIDELTEGIGAVEVDNNVIDASIDGTQLRAIGQNTPNPHNGDTQIAYNVSGADEAQLNVFDNTGRLVKTINIDTKTDSGVIDLSMTNMPAGAYNYNLVVDGQLISTKKMILSR